MLVNTEKMIPIGKLQKEFTQRLRDVSETGEPLYVLRNNEMAAVILSADEYALLREAEDILEHLEISAVIRKRLKGHKRSGNIHWEKVKQKHGI